MNRTAREKVKGETSAKSTPHIRPLLHDSNGQKQGSTKMRCCNDHALQHLVLTSLYRRIAEDSYLFTVAKFLSVVKLRSSETVSKVAYLVLTLSCKRAYPREPSVEISGL
jgi:hypothetical protein